MSEIFPETTPATAGRFVDAQCYDDKHRTRGVYRMVGQCYNCSTEPVLGLFTFGHATSGGVLGPECPVCGVRDLRWKRLATPDEIPADFEVKP